MHLYDFFDILREVNTGGFSFLEEDERICLLWAVGLGTKADIRLRLEQGEEYVNFRDPDTGLTPLTLAALRGDQGIVLELLRRGARVNSEGPDGNTALMYASEAGHLEIVKALLTHNKDVHGGADPNAKNFDGQTALQKASFWGRDGVIRELLKGGKVDLSSQDLKGNTALHFAALGGRESVCRELIRAGAAVNAKNTEGLTAFHLAEKTGKPAVVQVFLKARGEKRQKLT